MSTTRVRGRLKTFSPDRGFGFIVPNQAGDDIFLHRNTIRKSGYQDCIPGCGCEMEVEVAERDRGRIAIKIFWIEWLPQWKNGERNV